MRSPMGLWEGQTSAGCSHSAADLDSHAVLARFVAPRSVAHEVDERLVVAAGIKVGAEFVAGGRPVENGFLGTWRSHVEIAASVLRAEQDGQCLPRIGADNV